jgi:hypothetical protein
MAAKGLNDFAGKKGAEVRPFHRRVRTPGS